MKPFCMKVLKNNNPYSKPIKKQYHVLKRERPAFPVILAQAAQVALTGGNVKSISLDMLNKILSPSDTSHPPSLLFVLAFCLAAKDFGPLRIITQAVGFGLMDEEERMLCEIHKAEMAEKAAKKKKLLLKKILEERL